MRGPVTATPHSVRPAAAALVLAGTLVLTACGGTGTGTPETSAVAPAPTTSESAAETTPAPSSSTPPAATGTTITTGGSEFGAMLFGGPGQAIYLFDKETDGQPACYEDCATAWPPVLTDGAPQASGEVQPGLLGTVPRADGSTQVTYAGHPLYYYAFEGPGEVTCHDVAEYGGTWLVVTPAGTPAP
jgi:predicted lipoprotein with Yx(FWY)xxD motif